MTSGGHHRGRRVGAHAAGHRAAVAVEGALVVLGGAEQEAVGSVGQDEERGLLAGHELLDDDAGAGAFGEDRVEGGVGLGEGFGDGDALAGGEAVGLDHDRGAPGVGEGVGGVGVGEGLAGGGGGAAGGADLLGEGLGGFEAGRLAARAEGADAGGAQRVGDAFGKRSLGAYHHEVDGVLGAEAGDLVAVEDVERDAGRLLGDAGVAGGAPEAVDLRVLGEGPGERMLAAAAAEDEDVHAPLHRRGPRSVSRGGRESPQVGTRGWTRRDAPDAGVRRISRSARRCAARRR